MLFQYTRYLFALQIFIHCILQELSFSQIQQTAKGCHHLKQIVKLNFKCKHKSMGLLKTTQKKFQTNFDIYSVNTRHMHNLHVQNVAPLVTRNVFSLQEAICTMLIHQKFGSILEHDIAVPKATPQL